MTLEQYIAKVDYLFNNIDGIINEILSDPKNVKSLMVKPRQRMRQSGPWPSVGEYKNPGAYKNIFGQKKIGNIKLFDKGIFNKSLFIEMVGRKIQMDSNHPERRAMLVTRYGENIFNVKSDEVNFIITNFIRPELIKLVEPGEALTINLG